MAAIDETKSDVVSDDMAFINAAMAQIAVVGETEMVEEVEREKVERARKRAEEQKRRVAQAKAVYDGSDKKSEIKISPGGPVRASKPRAKDPHDEKLDSLIARMHSKYELHMDTKLKNVSFVSDKDFKDAKKRDVRGPMKVVAKHRVSAGDVVLVDSPLFWAQAVSESDKMDETSATHITALALVTAFAAEINKGDLPVEEWMKQNLMFAKLAQLPPMIEKHMDEKCSADESAAIRALLGYTTPIYTPITRDFHGVGLYSALRFVNFACRRRPSDDDDPVRGANVEILLQPGPDNRIVLSALRDIPKGEEVTICPQPHLNDYGNGATARGSLGDSVWGLWGDCACSVCVDESAFVNELAVRSKVFVTTPPGEMTPEEARKRYVSVVPEKSPEDERIRAWSAAYGKAFSEKRFNECAGMLFKLQQSLITQSMKQYTDLKSVPVATNASEKLWAELRGDLLLQKYEDGIRLRYSLGSWSRNNALQLGQIMSNEAVSQMIDALMQHVSGQFATCHHMQFDMFRTLHAIMYCMYCLLYRKDKARATYDSVVERHKTHLWGFIGMWATACESHPEFIKFDFLNKESHHSKAISQMLVMFLQFKKTGKST